MKEYNKKLTEDMYQKWLNGTKVSQLQEENNLGRDAIYKRFARLRQENAQEDVEEVSEIDENDNEVVVHNFTAADNEFDSNDNDDMMPNNDADVLAPEIGNSNNTILYAMIGIGLAIAVVFLWPKSMGCPQKNGKSVETIQTNLKMATWMLYFLCSTRNSLFQIIFFEMILCL